MAARAQRFQGRLCNEGETNHQIVTLLLGTSLVPRPCMFVARSTKFAQRAWAHSSHDVCHRLVFTSQITVFAVLLSLCTMELEVKISQVHTIDS